jgi:hypothetical protein
MGNGHHGESRRRADGCHGGPSDPFNCADLSSSQVNVALPDVPEAKDIGERFQQQKYFMDQMFEAKTFAAVVS